jgi:hypothetical protein
MVLENRGSHNMLTEDLASLVNPIKVNLSDGMGHIIFDSNVSPSSKPWLVKTAIVMTQGWTRFLNIQDVDSVDELAVSLRSKSQALPVTED